MKIDIKKLLLLISCMILAVNSAYCEETVNSVDFDSKIIEKYQTLLDQGQTHVAVYLISTQISKFIEEDPKATIGLLRDLYRKNDPATKELATHLLADNAELFVHKDPGLARDVYSIIAEIKPSDLSCGRESPAKELSYTNIFMNFYLNKEQFTMNLIKDIVTFPYYYPKTTLTVAAIFALYIGALDAFSKSGPL